jgi:hypothetical protein
MKTQMSAYDEKLQMKNIGPDLCVYVGRNFYFLFFIVFFYLFKFLEAFIFSITHNDYAY